MKKNHVNQFNKTYEQLYLQVDMYIHLHPHTYKLNCRKAFLYLMKQERFGANVP